MERKVARARGERTIDEKKDLEIEIKELQEQNEILTKDNKDLINSLKKLGI